MSEIEKHEGLLQQIYADPIGRWILLILLIVLGFGFVFAAGQKLWKNLVARLDRVIDQVENDHVADPAKTSNIRDDIDRKFEAVHASMSVMSRAIVTQGENVSTILKELAEINGKDVDIERTRNGTELIRLREHNNERSETRKRDFRP